MQPRATFEPPTGPAPSGTVTRHGRLPSVDTDPTARIVIDTPSTIRLGGLALHVPPDMPGTVQVQYESVDRRLTAYPDDAEYDRPAWGCPLSDSRRMS